MVYGGFCNVTAAPNYPASTTANRQWDFSSSQTARPSLSSKSGLISSKSHRIVAGMNRDFNIEALPGLTRRFNRQCVRDGREIFHFARGIILLRKQSRPGMIRHSVAPSWGWRACVLRPENP
jgi:hypothetical protein